MYERFTDRSRAVMLRANQEARRFKHEYIGTEHILLGLIAEGAGVAANVLHNLDLDLRNVRRDVERILGSAAGPDAADDRLSPQTPRAKKVIEFAIEEARGLNHNYVGTEHLLLGLLRETDGVACVVLMNHGLTVSAVREEVKNLLGLLPADRADIPVVHKVEAKAADDTFPLGLPPDVRELVATLARRIAALQTQNGAAVDDGQFELAAMLRDRQDNLKRARDAIIREWQSPPPTAGPTP